MSPQAYVLDAGALEALRAALRRYAGRCAAVLPTVEARIQQVIGILHDQERFWRAEVERRRWAYERCLSYRDPYGYPVDCSAERWALAEAEEKLDRVRQWMLRVEEEAEAYRRSAYQFRTTLEDDISRAEAFLEQKLRILEAYHALILTEAGVAGQGSAARGAVFEDWARKHIFGGKRRITVSPEHNMHLARVDEEGIGLLRRRASDAYVDDDGSLWDLKAYSEGSAVDADQLRDYSLMEQAGYVFDAQGQRIAIKSVNYLFRNRAAAQANAWRLQGLATLWYVDETGEVVLLEDQ